MARFSSMIFQSLFCVALIAAPAIGSAQTAGATSASTNPLGDLSKFRTMAESSLKLAKAGDIPGAHVSLTAFETSWDNAADQLRPKSFNTWKSIDNQLDRALGKLSAKKPDQAGSEKAIEDLISKLK